MSGGNKLNNKTLYEWLEEKIGKEELYKEINIEAILELSPGYDYYKVSNTLQNSTVHHWLV